MTVPRIFATHAAGNVPAAYLDEDFAACLANTGTTSIALYGAIADWNGTTGTNNEFAVTAAITAGATNIFIPANCLYKVTGSILPDDINFIGENWISSVISSEDRTTDNLYMGARASYKNVGIISLFGDDVAGPNTDKVCPVGWLLNSSDTPNEITNWVGQGINFFSGPSMTTSPGVTSTDLPLIAASTNAALSDACFFGSFADSSAAIRMVTLANNATGMYLLNGWNQVDNTLSADNQLGIYIKDFNDGTNTEQYSIKINRIGNGTSIFLDNQFGPNTQTKPYVSMDITKQASGNIINMFQATTPYSGNFIGVSAGTLSGTFSGHFLQFDNAGSYAMFVNSDGTVQSAKDIVAGQYATTGGQLLAYAAAASNPTGVIAIQASRGTTLNPTTTASGDVLAAFVARGYDGAAYRAAAQIGVTVNSAVSSGIVPGYFTVSTANTSGAMTLALSIDQAQLATFASGIVQTDSAALIRTAATLANGAGAQTATMTNGPTAGNPSKWIAILDNGTPRYIPTWS